MKLPPPRRTLAGCVGSACAALLIAFVPTQEGVVLKTYADPAYGWNLPTACMGHTGPELKQGQTFTRAECDAMLESDLIKHADGVLACVHVPMHDGEKAAFVSFAFNVGTSAFCKSTAARLLNAGDHAAACAELTKWTRAGGRVLPGLVKRRAAERAMCERKA